MKKLTYALIVCLFCASMAFATPVSTWSFDDLSGSLVVADSQSNLNDLSVTGNLGFEQVGANADLANSIEFDGSSYTSGVLQSFDFTQSFSIDFWFCATKLNCLHLESKKG